MKEVCNKRISSQINLGREREREREREKKIVVEKLESEIDVEGNEMVRTQIELTYLQKIRRNNVLVRKIVSMVSISF